MKKISFLMLLALAFLLSCRTDQFPEKETYHNTSAFQLISKRISLKESKHKVKLLHEIEQVETKFKTFSKNNVQGKLVNYANGVSIDTDEAIYIENGPNYHTYTFNIYRENAPENAPLENLVLSLMPDGSYQEFLVAYNLTSQEKEKIRNGEPVNTKGKTTISELAKGSFNANGQLLQAKTTCSWNDITVIYSCSELDKNGNPYHDASNMSDWHNCTAGTKPSVFTAGFWDCTPEKLDNHISPGSNPGGGGSVGGGDDSEDCATFATDPSQVGITNPNGCNTVFPTQPYAPTSFRFIVRTLPTEVKALLNSNTAFYDGLDAYYTANPTLQGENFVRWAAQFRWENQNVTWAQFQNWFINGYSNTYRTKLSLLSPTEIQEFVSINTEIDASPYDEEFVKEANEAYVAFTAYGDLETMTEAQMEYVFNNNCCAGLFITQFSVEKTKQIFLDAKLLKKLYPGWSIGKCVYEASRDTLHLLLDIGGMFPLVGEVCDITNGAIYTMDGDQLNAALSYGSAIPFAGWGATVAKFATKTVHLANGTKTTLKFLRRIDGVVTFGNRGQLRKVLGLVKGDLRQAHHIIPWELSNRPAIQKAALSSNAFHLNEALNGIPLSNAVHSGSHANYTLQIENYLNAIPSNYTPNQVYTEVIKIINKAKIAIQTHPNTPINQLVF